MTTYYTELKELVFRFENLGVQVTENEVFLIGKAPFLGKEAWLNKIYPTLNHDEIKELETSLKHNLPPDFRKFLNQFSNGLNILYSTLSIYGYRKTLGRTLEASRQPYSILTPNNLERPLNAKNTFVFIGGYNWDGSLLYIDTETNKVHCCSVDNADSCFNWNTFDEMLYSEINRLYSLVDNTGKELIEDRKTIPY